MTAKRRRSSDSLPAPCTASSSGGRKLLGDRLARRGLALSAALMAAAVGEGVSPAALSQTAALSLAEAATLFASGKPAAGSGVSASVLSLTQEALRSMVLTKLKYGVATVLCAGALLAAAGGTLAPAGSAQDAHPPPGKPAKAATKHGARAKDAAAEDTRELQGEWQVIEYERDGKRAPSYRTRSEGMSFTFKGEEMKCSFWDGKCEFRLDPARSPRAIDIRRLEGRLKGQTEAGIYSLSNARLQLCLPGLAKDSKRPTEFKTRNADGRELLVLERVRPRGAGTETGLCDRPGDAAAAAFGAVLREWRRADQEFSAARHSAKAPDERRKVMAEKAPKPEPFAEHCLKLAEKYPDTPAGLAALWWAISIAPESAVGSRAVALLKAGRITRANLDELGDALDPTARPNRTMPQELGSLVVARVKQDLSHPRAAALLTEVCVNDFGDSSAEAPRAFAEAAELITGRFADSPDIANFCECLGSGNGSLPWAGSYEKHLRTVLKANRHRYVRVCAQFALASVVQGTGEARQEEAEKLYHQFVKEYDGQDPKELGFLPDLLSRAKAEIEEIRTRGPGKPAREIEGEDLDGRPMRLSDFKGKVVLLDFWGFW